MNINSETHQIIKDRLNLAQSLLEESDSLPGYHGYDFINKRKNYHPRHEREALVVYLLLTCFDKLGQNKNRTSFEGWLNSKKKVHLEEKSSIISELNSKKCPIESAKHIFNEYNRIYSVRNSFYSGIMSLPETQRAIFLDSIRVSFDPIYGSLGPNTSTPSYPIDNKEDELELKLKYIYDIRNRFTHNLNQYHSSSIPILSRKECDSSSWIIFIEEGDIVYWGNHTDRKILSEGGAYIYSLREWPFILFETLYSAIGVDFDRTDINLKFQVKYFSKENKELITYDCVSHKIVKDLISTLVIRNEI